MHDDDAAETKRRLQSARTPVAAKKGVTAKNVPKLIDPERLSKAIRYLKENPTLSDDADQGRRRSAKKTIVEDRS
jgi:hypothetical protein